MARKLPLSAAPPDDFDAAGIEATLARLPDAWTLIHDRRIGGEDGPHVAWVLLHPEIGVALVDLAPAAPLDAVAALRALIDPADRALAGVPIVALAVAPNAGAALGQQLADAFAAAPPCRTADPDWTDRIEGLLLNAEDAAMAPLTATLGDPRPEPAWRPHIASDDAILPPPPAQRQPPARRLPFAAAVAFLAVAILAVSYLLARGPVADNSAVAVRMPIEAPTAASAKRADTMPTPMPMPAAKAIATPAAPLAAKAAPPPLPPASPVAALPAENTAASSPPLPAPRPVVARRPVRHARPRRTALASAPRDLAPVPDRAMGAPPQPAASGPPIDANDLPPLPQPAPVQQAANRPIDAPMPPTPHGGALASGQPMMLLPPIGPPAAMPPPPSSGPGAGAIVGGPP